MFPDYNPFEDMLNSERRARFEREVIFPNFVEKPKLNILPDSTFLKEYDQIFDFNKLEANQIVPAVNKAYEISLTENIYRQFRSDFQKELISYLQNNLKKFGHEFCGEDEFLEFAKFRIARFDFPEEEEVHYYLDFKNEGDPGQLIGVTHENRTRIEFKDGKIIGTIG